MRPLVPVAPFALVLLGLLCYPDLSWSQQATLSPQARKALDYYLNVDCEVGEKRRPLTELLQFKVEVEPSLIEIVRNGPDQKTLDRTQRSLEEQWARRQAFLKKNPRLGLSHEHLRIAQSMTQDTYVKEGRARFIRSYRKKAAVALVAIDSDEARKVLKEVSAADEELRNVIDVARKRLHPPQQSASQTGRSP